MNQEVRNGVTYLTASEGFIRHKVTQRILGKQTYLMNGETVDMYEEVSEMPPYTKEEYDSKVEELVAEKYSHGAESAIQRKMINVMRSPHLISDGEDSKAESIIAEYEEYNAYVENCKLEAPDRILEDRKAREAERLEADRGGENFSSKIEESL